MTGYVRASKSLLRVCDLELYKACYCGVCHAIKKRYGFLASNILAYDFAFLAMLLVGEPLNICKKRCAPHPFKKRCVATENVAFDRAADANVLFFYWKLEDACIDSKGLKRLFYRLLKRFFKSHYVRASKFLPITAKKASRAMPDLWALEGKQVASIDAPADCFAQMLSALSECAEGEKKRILSEILYTVGRWIYIIDAVDDIKEDLAEKRYNPVVKRYELGVEGLTDEIKSELIQTLEHSLHRAQASLSLLDNTEVVPILENILTAGLPLIQKTVLQVDTTCNSKKFRKSSKGKVSITQ